MQEDWTDFIPFVLAILVAIGGLFLIDAGEGGSGVAYALGMVVFALACLFGFWAIARFFDRAQARRRHDGHRAAGSSRHLRSR